MYQLLSSLHVLFYLLFFTPCGFRARIYCFVYPRKVFSLLHTSFEKLLLPRSPGGSQDSLSTGPWRLTQSGPIRVPTVGVQWVTQLSQATQNSFSQILNSRNFVSLPGYWLRFGMWRNPRQRDSGGSLSTVGDCWKSFLSLESKDLPLFAFKQETDAYQSLSLISLSQGWLMEGGVEARECTAGPSWPGWILHLL